MATQTRKIKNKIAPRAQEKAKQEAAKLKPKASRDIMLIAMIALTAIILILAWPNMDQVGRGMYGCLLGGMVVVYVNRHMDFTERVKKILIVVSLTALTACLILLGYSIYTQYFA